MLMMDEKHSRPQRSADGLLVAVQASTSTKPRTILASFHAEMQVRGSARGSKVACECFEALELVELPSTGNGGYPDPAEHSARSGR